MSASVILNKVWNYAHVLRDDGVGYGDYVEAALARLGNCSCIALPSHVHVGRSASRHRCIHAQCKLPINEVPHECV